MSITRWKVRLHSFKADNVVALDRGGTSDPYLKVDFDNFKTFETAKVSKTCNPRWVEDVSFTYETKLANKLHLKKLKIKCYDANRFTTDSLIGRCYLDLYALATGPSEFRMPIRDGGRINGELRFRCEMVEVASLELNFRNVELVLPPQLDEIHGEHASDYYLEYAYTGDPQWMKRTRKSPPGRTQFSYLDALYASTTYEEIISSNVIFWFKRRKTFGSDEMVAKASVPLRNCYNFHDGMMEHFSVSLQLDNNFVVENQISNPRQGTLAGNLFYANFPKFLQMRGGYFTDNGIFYGALLDAKVPNQPRVLVHSSASATPGHSHQPSGGNFPAVPQRTAPHVYMTQPIGSSSHHSSASMSEEQYPDMSKLSMGSGSNDNSAQSSRAYQVAGNDHSNVAQSKTPPVSTGYQYSKPAPSTSNGSSAYRTEAPKQSSSDSFDCTPFTNGSDAKPVAHETHSVNSNTGAASANNHGLPWFWEPATDPSTGKLYFKNHAYKGTEWSLPTAPVYDITILYPGPIGLELERNFSGEERFGPGKKSGRRMSRGDIGAVVASVAAGGQADQASGKRVRPGHHVIAINGRSLLQYPYAACIDMLVKAPRPVRLTFSDPYAVLPSVAQSVTLASSHLNRPHSTHGAGTYSANSNGYGNQPTHPTYPQSSNAHAHGIPVHHSNNTDGYPFAQRNIPVAPPMNTQPSNSSNGYQAASKGTRGSSSGPGKWVMDRDSSGRICYRNTASGKISYDWPPR